MKWFWILNFLDVVNEASIKSCFETVTKICGEAGLSCLINNSGKNIKPDAELTGLTFDKFNDIFGVNTFAPAVVSKVHSLLFVNKYLLNTTELR